MKIINKYQCEYCNTIYNTEDGCTSCEQGHLDVFEIVNKEYNQYENFPTRIVLRSKETGLQFTYKRIP